MEPKKISELPLTNIVNITGLTAVVQSGITYSASLETLKETIVDSQEHTFEGDQVITGDLTVNGQIINTKAIPNITYAELLNLINTSGFTPFSYFFLQNFPINI